MKTFKLATIALVTALTLSSCDTIECELDLECTGKKAEAQNTTTLSTQSEGEALLYSQVLYGIGVMYENPYRPEGENPNMVKAIEWYCKAGAAANRASIPADRNYGKQAIERLRGSNQPEDIGRLLRDCDI